MSNDLQPAESRGLLALAEGKRWLAHARDVLLVKEFRDRAAALERYLRQRDDADTAARDAAELRLRAERRLGELLAETVNHNGTRADLDNLRGSTVEPRASTLPDGIDKKQSHRYQQAAKVPEAEFERHVERARAEADVKGLTSVAVRRLVAAAKREERRADIIHEVVMPAGPFRVIVADPPWEYRNRVDDASHRGACPYRSMSLEEIKAYLPAGLAHPDSVLWLWTTNAHMPHAFEVLRAWGFEHKTILTWVKDRMGLGDWLRGKTEHCLLAVRGRPLVTLTNQTTVLHGPLRQHSRKPDEFYALVEALCPGSKVELFARSQRPGWVCQGNQPDAFP
jgi:N6-adenosine-specific RNA methylase IME4